MCNLSSLELAQVGDPVVEIETAFIYQIMGPHLASKMDSAFNWDTAFSM